MRKQYKEHIANLVEKLREGQWRHLKLRAEGMMVVELQREIVNLKQKLGHLEDMNSAQVLIKNRLQKFHEVERKCTTMSAQHMAMEMNTTKKKKQKGLKIVV